jgi:hypothetical protein
MKLTELAESLAAKVEAAGDAEGRREAIKGWLLAQKKGVLAMYEEEDVPFVVNHAAPGDLALGDYVFASRWSDCNPGDPWAVGHISELGPNFVVVGDANLRHYPNAMRISEEQGRRIIEQFPPMEADGRPIEYEEIARVFGVPASRLP